MYINNKNNFTNKFLILTGITKLKNELNVKLHRKEKPLTYMYSDIKSFSVKLKLFYKHIEEKN